VVRDDVGSAGLERREDGAVHPGAIHAEMAEVVIVEHERHQIQRVGGNLGRRRVLEAAHDRDDVRGRRILRALGEALRARGTGPRVRGRGSRLGRGRRRAVRIRRRALPVDLPRGTGGARDQLRRVAAARAYIQRHHARPHAHEREHRLRLAARIVAAVRRAAVRAGDDLGDALAADRARGLASNREYEGRQREQATHHDAP
jgi:hypothetical protein